MMNNKTIKLFDNDKHFDHSGLTIRDQFAREANETEILKNLSPEQITVLMNRPIPHSIKNKIVYDAELRARIKYIIADQMIKVREL